MAAHLFDDAPSTIAHALAVSLTKLSPSIETALRAELPDGTGPHQEFPSLLFHLSLVLWPHPRAPNFTAPALLDVVLKAYGAARKLFDTLTLTKKTHEVAPGRGMDLVPLAVAPRLTTVLSPPLFGRRAAAPCPVCALHSLPARAAAFAGG